MKPIILKKQNQVNEIKDKLNKSNLVLLCNYSGSDVSLLNSLRKELRKNKAEIKVYKNTLTKLALNEMQNNTLDQYLEGPTAMINADEDPLQVIKFFKKFLGANEVFKFKAGLFTNEFIGEKEFSELAKLPPREELIARVIGLLKSPITNLVSNLSSPLRGFVYVLNSIKVKKEEEK
ncbi:MAG: 50S ribosomal protein L10 [Candidatus Margulisiibacteriota bacterium]|jgi:large subunit ribosomal protein L10